MNLEWEQIDAYHRRAKVVGGWLVKAYEDIYTKSSRDGVGLTCGTNFRMSMCFVPDANYEWKLDD